MNASTVSTSDISYFPSLASLVFGGLPKGHQLLNKPGKYSVALCSGRERNWRGQDYVMKFKSTI